MGTKLENKIVDKLLEKNLINPQKGFNSQRIYKYDIC